MTVFEMNLVKYAAEYRVVHGIPDFDRQHDRCGFGGVNALEEQECYKISAYKGIDDVLTAEIEVIIHPLLL